MSETDDTVSHQIFRVARAHKALTGKLLKDAGLRPGQELVLMQLWENGPQRLIDLVRSLGTDAPSMTRAIGRLEAVGLVTRTRSGDDRRAIVVDSTDAGRTLQHRVNDAWAELERRTLADVSAADEAAIRATLTLLEHNLT